MSIDPLSDAKIIDSWGRNAVPWTAAVREQQIESRRLVTDRAIVEATLGRSPRSVLDIGCGEGWLARVLAAAGIHVIGIDAIPTLIEQARQAGGGDFRVMSYEDIAAGKIDDAVDAVVCNFALLGNESVDGLFGAVRSLLNPHGSLLIQTLHPLAACGDHPYQMAGGKAPGLASTPTSATRRPGISGPWKAGSNFSRSMDCGCWRYASRCIRRHASPCRRSSSRRRRRDPHRCGYKKKLQMNLLTALQQSL